MPFIVAIDGPAGAGKSTVARRLAQALGFIYLDTGAMYRAVALKVLRSGVDPGDSEKIVELALSSEVGFSDLTPDGSQRVWLDGEDVSAAIRTPEVSALTSSISTLAAVRHVVVSRQRDIGRSASNGVVLEGRDIGTVVFPDAGLKVFLTAGAEERARRRYAEMRAKGLEADYNTVLADQEARDARDSTRAASPLIAAEDAVHLITDGLTIDQVVEQLVAWCLERQPDLRQSL